MAAFKNIALLSSTWGEIISLIEASPVEADHVLAEMLREQLNGSVKVSVTGKTVTFKASKGGALRSSLGVPK